MTHIRYGSLQGTTDESNYSLRTKVKSTAESTKDQLTIGESQGSFQSHLGHDYSIVGNCRSQSADSQLKIAPWFSSFQSPHFFQTKLIVNTPGDKYEQEADRVADQVMHLPEPQAQRHCVSGKSSNESGAYKCEEIDTKTISHGSVSSPLPGSSVPKIIESVVSSPGNPLPTATRSFMELRFGHDFSQVRVHTDERAAESAEAIQAKAYTVGNNIVFGNGKSVSNDARLVAHELAHVIQQSGATATDKAAVTTRMRLPVLQRDVDTTKTKTPEKGAKPSEDRILEENVDKSKQFAKLVKEAIKDYGDKASRITESDLLALIAVESSGNPNEVTKGIGKYRGLFQLSKADDYDSQEIKRARLAKFNKGKDDPNFSWNDKSILDPATNIRYGTFVVFERWRIAQEEIGRKASLEKKKDLIAKDFKQLEQEKADITKRINDPETKAEEKAELRERRKGIRGRRKGLEIHSDENESALKSETLLEPANKLLKDFLNSNPSAATYLLHQQGIEGLRRTLANPTAKVPTERLGNLTPDGKKTVKTNQDFVKYWIARFDKAKTLL